MANNKNFVVKNGLIVGTDATIGSTLSADSATISGNTYVSGNMAVGTNLVDAKLTVRASTNNSTETLASFSELDGYALGSTNIGLVGGSAYLEMNATGGAVNVHIDAYGDTYFNGGNVGIGTDQPEQSLHVSGKGIIRDGGYPYLELGISATNYFRAVHDNPNDTIVFQKYGLTGNIMTLHGGSGIGVSIGDATNNKNLNVHGEVTANQYNNDEVRHSIRPTLNLDFANSKQLDPRITFYRDSIATYYDSKGVLRYANVNEPRFDHNPVTGESKGLLIEEARTNSLSVSSGATIVSSEHLYFGSIKDFGGYLIPNYAIAPNGKMQAAALYGDGSSGSARVYWAYASGTHTFSVYAKDNGSGEFSIWAYASSWVYSNKFTWSGDTLTEATPGSNTVLTPVGNGWYRVSVTFTAPSNGSVLISPGAYSAWESGDSTLIWGAQLELNQSFATSYVPTDTRFTSRSSIATYHDETGILRTAPANSPRYGYKYDGRKWVETGLILENAATNLIPNSDNPNMYTQNGVTSSYVVCPDGVSRDALFTPTTSTTQHFVNSGWNATSGTTYCMSFYAKDYGVGEVSYHMSTSAFTSGSVYFNFDTETITKNGDAISGGYEKLADGWYRIWCVATADATASDSFYIGIPDLSSYAGDGSSGVAVWGLQAEAGYAPTSFIYTISATTRSADVATSTAYTRQAEFTLVKDNNFDDDIDIEEGTLFVDMEVEGLDAGQNYALSLGNAAGALVIFTDSGSWYASQWNMSNNSNVSPGANNIKAALRYSLEGNFYGHAVNGLLKSGTTAYNSNINYTARQLAIGHAPNLSTSGLNGWYKKVSVYSEALSEAEITALTENN